MPRGTGLLTPDGERIVNDAWYAGRVLELSLETMGMA
jgi:hypothetical protein